MIHQVLIILENVKLQFSGKLAKDITTQWSTSCGKKIVKNIKVTTIPTGIYRAALINQALKPDLELPIRLASPGKFPSSG